MKRLHKENLNTPEHFHNVWNDVIEKRPYYDKYRHLALIENVTHGHKVLDVGAGIFGSCQYIAERTNIKAELHCIDFSQKAYVFVTTRHPKINFLIAPVDTLPYGNKTFDCVIAGEIIEHMEDPATFVAEMCRVSRGWVNLTTVDTSSAAAKKHGDYPEHLWEFSSNDLISFFAPFGMVKYRLVGNYHFISCKVK